MKRAKLGFRFISLENELQVVESEDITLSKEARQRRSHTKSKATKLRCYNKHRDSYNAQRRNRGATIHRRYKEAERQAAIAHVQWGFTEESWEQAWSSAGWVVMPGSQSAAALDGTPVPAFALRGPHRYNNTCMVRKDLSKGWNPDNCEIVFRGVPLVPGSRWYVAPPVVLVEDDS